jgi:MFS family permease
MAVELRRSGSVSPALEVSAGSADLELAVSQLAKNYDILRGQATQGFVLAAFFMVLGICVILVGAVGDLFGFAKAGSNLTTVAGIVVEAISGLGLYLFRSTFNRLNRNSDLLLETWKILAAFKKAQDLPEERRGDVQVTLIGKLVGLTEPTESKAG